MQSLWEFDQSVFRAVQGFRQPWLDTIFIGITSTGLGWVQIVLLFILFASWRDMGSPRKLVGWRGARGEERTQFLIPLLLGYAVSGVVNQVVKRLIERERPSNLVWSNPLEDIHFNSFVSGHTATSFGIAATFFWVTRGTRYALWGAAGWIWATLVGISRVYVGVHWPTDVIGGAAVGIVCGTWVAWLARSTRKAELE